MPHKLPHGCAAPGCRELVQRGPHCPTHRRALDAARGSSAERGYNTPEWRRARRAVLQRDSDRFCRICSPQGENSVVLIPSVEVDHIVPRREWVAAGGDFCDPSNLQGLCKRCHSRKTLSGR